MLRRVEQDEQWIDPDQPMVGKCLTCGMVVTALRAACEIRIDPGLGQVICVACPREVGRDPMSGNLYTCGTRVRMVRSHHP